MKRIQKSIGLLVASMLLWSCSSYLDLKPDNSFDVPSSLEDLRRLLDNSDMRMNQTQPGLGEMAADSYLVKESDWTSFRDEYTRQLYLWQPYTTGISEWSSPYEAIMYANTVLSYLPRLPIKKEQEALAKELEGAARVFRAYNLIGLLDVFAKAYNPKADNQQLGVVLRKEATISEELKRSSVKDCYDFVQNDFLRAIPLLPSKQSFLTRPSKGAAYAGLARLYLVMADFERAGLYADSALQLNTALLDYQRDINLDAALPFGKWNKEVIFDISLRGGEGFYSGVSYVSGRVYAQYEANDLRKKAFFKRNSDTEIYFKGRYNGLENFILFCGPTTAEMYLIRAEVHARADRLQEAAADINTLRKNRIAEADFLPVDFATKAEALGFIKLERERELIYRGTRWPDMRRYILLGEYDGYMERSIGGKTYTMQAADIINYVFKLPDRVIDNSDYTQN